METLKSFLDQTLLIWKDSTAAARFGLALLLILCVGGVVGVGIWSSRPNYVVLASHLAPEKSAEVIDALDTANIAYEVKGAGSIISVDKRKWALAQVATGTLGIRNSGPDIEVNGMFPNPNHELIVERRNLEAQLVYSIESMPAIASAKVHLNIPKKQAFIRHSTAPSASVVLEITPGMRFDDSHAATIASTIAYSVADLSLERVSVADVDGNKYVIDESTGNLSRQEEIRINRERECVQKVQTMLAKVVGFGNSVVSVTADFTFKDETKTATEYDPDGKVTLEESILTSETTGESPRPAVGASGAESNINNAAGSAGRGKTILSKQEDMTSKLGHSMTITEGTYNSPTLNQLSVSVQINSAKINEIDTPEFRQSIQTAIQKAVGFRDAQDEISVEFLPFANVPIPEIPVAFALPWDKINEMLKNISLGIAAIIALFMARKAFNKIQPDPAAVQDVVNKESQVNQLSELVKDNPEVFSKIIASWSSLESNEESDGTQSRKAA